MRPARKPHGRDGAGFGIFLTLRRVVLYGPPLIKPLRGSASRPRDLGTTTNDRVFDRRRGRSLKSWGFGVPGAGRAVGLPVLAVLPLATLCLAGCTSRSIPGREEDSLTSGRIEIVCAPEASRLIERECSVFRALYPTARLDLRVATSREAIRSLFAAESHLAVITRELDVEERAAAVRGGLGLEGYRFARDAVAAVVNPANPIQNVAVEQLRRIYTGEVSRWWELGGRDAPIVPVAQPLESDLGQYFLQAVMGGNPVRARVLTAADDSAVVVRVRSDRDALGWVSLAWANRGTRALAVAGVVGLAYRYPDPEAVYGGSYPLTRFYNLYARTGGPQLANGFITFVTSRDGQALVQRDGLVPTAVPVRFVRRSPMVGTH